MAAHGYLALYGHDAGKFAPTTATAESAAGLGPVCRVIYAALRFLLDENQRGLLWRAVVRHNQLGAYPLDVVRVGDTPDLPLRSTDPEILIWSEREERILVSFDKATLARHLAKHLQAGHHSHGIFMLRRGSRLAQVVAHLALVAYASDARGMARSDRVHSLLIASADGRLIATGNGTIYILRLAAGK